jgi:hypothetical protein
VGLLMAFGAFNMDTSVSSFDGGSVNNLGLLQQQMMLLQTGLASFIAGCVLYAGATIADGSAPHSTSSKSAVRRPHETEQEREQRVAAVARLNRAIAFGLLGLVVLFVVVTISLGL